MRSNIMLVGVPKEIKNHEYRVGLTPAGVRELSASGHSILVELTTSRRALRLQLTLRRFLLRLI